MKKIIPLVASIMLILIAGIFASAGTIAQFSDTETSEGNKFEAGTLNLKVWKPGASWVNDPNVVHVTLSNMKPGDSVVYKWNLKNTGSLTGIASVEFSAITENENGANEPEELAEAKSYKGGTIPPLSTGELGYFLKTSIGRAPYSYDSWANGIGGGWTVGLPCPYEPNGYGLHALGGNTYTIMTLDSGDEIGFFLVMKLDDADPKDIPNNLQGWDGYGYYDIDDNLVQSDNVEFDIIFSLVQAP